MISILRRAASELKQNNKSLVLLCVLSKTGSAPRGKGALMLCDEDGLLAGSIGGGALEAYCIELALELSKKNHSEIKTFELKESSSIFPEMLCGGSVQVAFICLSATRELWLQRLAMCRNELNEGRVAKLELGIGNETITIFPEDKAFVFGGGHCAFALVPLLRQIGFRVIVIDDRPDFATAFRFPDAEQVICGDYQTVANSQDYREEDYVLIMTSGHNHDYEVLERVLRHPVAYVGCMGSKRKAAKLNEKLQNAGIDSNVIKKIYSPIGLSIGSETPEEIAVSIAAQLIAVRAGGSD